MSGCERCSNTGRVWHTGAQVQLGKLDIARHAWRWDFCACKNGQQARVMMAAYHHARANIPPEYDYTFAALRTSRSLSDQQRQLWAVAKRFAEAGGVLAIEGHAYRGLLALGMVGTGKSTLIGCVANELIARLGRAARWKSLPTLTREIRRYERTGGAEASAALDALYDDLQAVPVLILDDLGHERSTPVVAEALYTIVEYRMSYGAGSTTDQRFPLVTLLTSNRTPDQMREDNPTLTSRLLQMCIVLLHNRESNYLRRGHIVE